MHDQRFVRLDAPPGDHRVAARHSSRVARRRADVGREGVDPALLLTHLALEQGEEQLERVSRPIEAGDRVVDGEHRRHLGTTGDVLDLQFHELHIVGSTEELPHEQRRRVLVGSHPVRSVPLGGDDEFEATVRIQVQIGEEQRIAEMCSFGQPGRGERCTIAENHRAEPRVPRTTKTSVPLIGAER